MQIGGIALKLTRFEKARIIGARALQLSMGAPPLIKGADTLEPMLVALKELEREIIPITVRRRLPRKAEFKE